jgi:diaminohydroxyphosphoribosylaminopyrimidine deaminase/5-amino-6-(5-phosphoribosylamino)uracil reductase
MVTLKLAASFDGRIATVSGDSHWISGPVSRSWVHELRNQVDAILVGSGTVGSDDPQLTCRMRGGRDPLRVILDSRLSTNPQARTYTQKSTASTLIATTQAGAKRRHLFEQFDLTQVEIVTFPAQNGRVPIQLVLAELGKRGIKHVLIEGGGQVAAAALGEDVVDKVLFFYAPILLGGDGRAMIGTLGISQVAAGKKLHTVQVTQRGEDVVVSAYLQRAGEEIHKRKPE